MNRVSQVYETDDLPYTQFDRSLTSRLLLEILAHRGKVSFCAFIGP